MQAKTTGEISQPLFTRRVLIAVAVVTVTVVVLLGVGATVDVLMLFFLSVLLAIVLSSLSNWLRSHTPLSYRLALAVVLLAMVGLVVVTALVLGPRLSDQFDQLTESLPQSLHAVEQELQQYGWGRQLLNQIPDVGAITDRLLNSSGGIFAQITGIFSTTLNILANVAVVFFTALFLAMEPQTYIQNTVRLVPKSYRPRANEIMQALGDTLRRFLLSRFISMLVVGALTTIGLMVLGMPLALTLGIIAGLLSFMPTLGPVLAIIPAALLGLLQSPTQALYVIALYLGVQMVDNYLVTPLVVRFTVRLPPALIIIAQLLVGLVAGRLGFVLAAPLVAALVVLVRMTYVEDVLHDREVENG
jgi:predicted PurR-regulated permease PerM